VTVSARVLDLRARDLAKDVLAAPRLLRAGTRALPDFLVIGTMKGGTTSLYEYLATHPQVVPASTKEVHYFDAHHRRSSSWYRSHFPTRASLDQIDGGRTGESSPFYLYHPLAPARARALVPDARLIALVRDPAERALSHYEHNARYALDPLSFGAALRAEPARLAADDGRLLAGRGGRYHPHELYSYAARGRYADQLDRWVDAFGRGSMLVIRSDDLFERPAQVWDEVLAFLALDPAPPPAFANHNPGTGSSNLDPAIRADLAAHFAAANADLAARYGVDVSTWTRC